MTSPTAPTANKFQVYVVGGAVRDRLLNLPVHDRDYVVVGATPEAMIAAGFIPVGRDFPVFLHPDTKEEYALARSERKVAPGYGGFVFHTDPGVTLEEDLARRDLTINAMAEPLDGSAVIDPFDGQKDLHAQIFRHVSPAFVEDPVRLLRVARFAARFPQFTLAPPTRELLETMVRNGEVDALVPERVWAELARGLIATQPSAMVRMLADTGALARVAHPALAAPRALEWLDRAAQLGAGLALAVAVWVRGAELGEDEIFALANKLRWPSEVKEATLLLARLLDLLLQLAPGDDEGLLRLIEAADGLRRVERLRLLADGAGIVTEDGRRGELLAQQLSDARARILGVDAAAIAKGLAPEAIKKALFTARLAALGAANKKE